MFWVFADGYSTTVLGLGCSVGQGNGFSWRWLWGTWAVRDNFGIFVVATVGLWDRSSGWLCGSRFGELNFSFVVV